MKAKPIRDIVREKDGELVIRISKSWSEIFDIKAGHTVEFSPVKVTPLRLLDAEDMQVTIETTPQIPLRFVPAEDMMEETTVEKKKSEFLQKIIDRKIAVKRIGGGRTSVYNIGAKCRIYLKASLKQPPYFFGLGPEIYTKFNDGTKRFYIVLIAGGEAQFYKLPSKDISNWFGDVEPASTDGEWKFNTTKDHKLLLTGKPPIDISNYLTTLEDFFRDVGSI